MTVTALMDCSAIWKTAPCSLLIVPTMPTLFAVPLHNAGAWANIPPMPQRRHKPVFSKYLYRARNLVERFFNKLKHFRAVATRYDKHPENYLASVKLAAIRIWMRFNESVT